MMKLEVVAGQLDLDNESGENWNIGFRFLTATTQLPLAAPHVFNFYMPDYVPNSEFEGSNLVGPEFEIHNSATSIDFINLVDSWTFPQHTSMLSTWESDMKEEERALDFDD